MAQKFRALGTLPEFPSLIPSTHTVTHDICKPCSRSMLSSYLCGPSTHGHAYMQAKHTNKYTFKKDV